MKFNVACKGEVSLHTFPAHISFTLLTLVHLVTRISVLEQHLVCKLYFSYHKHGTPLSTHDENDFADI